MIYSPASIRTPRQQSRCNQKRKTKARPNERNHQLRSLTHVAEKAVKCVPDIEVAAEDTSHGNVRNYDHATTMALRTNVIPSGAEVR